MTSATICVWWWISTLTVGSLLLSSHAHNGNSNATTTILSSTTLRDKDYDPFQTMSTNEALRSMKPSEAGHLHNKVVRRVHDRLFELGTSTATTTTTSFNTRSSTHSGRDYTKIVLDEMQSLCGDDDACSQIIRDYLPESQRDLGSRKLGTHEAVDIRSVFFLEQEEDVAPQHEDMPELQGHLVHIYETMVEGFDAASSSSSLSTTVDDLLHQLVTLSDAVTNDATSSEHVKTAVQAVTSVAVGSTRLWMDVMQDPENEFHRIVHAGSYDDDDRRRVLEEEESSSDEDESLSSTSVSTSSDNNSGGGGGIGGFIGGLVQGINIGRIFRTTVRLILSDVFGAIKGAIVPSVLFVVGIGQPQWIVMGVTLLALVDSLGAVGLVIPKFWEVLICWAISPLFKCQFWSLQCSIAAIILPIGDNGSGDDNGDGDGDGDGDEED